MVAEHLARVEKFSGTRYNSQLKWQRMALLHLGWVRGPEMRQTEPTYLLLPLLMPTVILVAKELCPAG